MELNSEQQQIHDWIMRDLNLAIETDIFDLKLISLSGQAGTGKSFLTAQLIESIITQLSEKICIDRFSPIVQFCAPTHKATNNLREMVSGFDHRVKSGTIHSFLNLTVSHDPMTGKQLLKKRNKEFSKRCGILLVDESSMISEQLLYHILTALKQGDVKAVVFIGDYYQLSFLD